MDTGQHSHHAGHSHADLATFATSTGAGVRALRIGVAGLALTTLVQVVLYSLSGSVALLGDLLHNGIDVIGTGIVWMAFGMTRRRPSDRFSFGYHRFEDIAGLAVVLLIAASAAVVLYEAATSLGGSPAIERPWVVLAAGLVGLVGNEGVALFKIRAGKRIGSAALVADGHHSQADGLSSAGVVVAAIGLLVGLDWLDAVAGLGIGLFIGWTALQSGRDIVLRLVDTADPALCDELVHIAGEIEGVDHVNDLRMRQAGRIVHVVANVCMPSGYSLMVAHEAAECLREAWLRALPPGSAVDIHIDPYTAGEASPHHAQA